MDSIHSIVFLFVGGMVICPSVSGTCSLPFTGDWISADRGQLSFASTTMKAYPVTIPGLSTMDFTCIDQVDSQILLQAEQFLNIFGKVTKFFLCLDIHKINDNVYTYFMGTNYDFIVQDFMYPLIDAIATISEACNRPQPYEPETFISLVKVGSVDNGLVNPDCPTDLLARFSSITITDGGGSENCPGTALDVCTDSNKLNYTYEACSTKKAFSGKAGSCIHHVTVVGVTYLSVWNNDASHDYQFSCYAIKKVGNTVFVSETPKFCTNLTTPYVAGILNSTVTGITLSLSDISDVCEKMSTNAPTSTTSTTSEVNLLYLLLLIPLYILASFVALLIVVLCITYGCCKAKRKSEKPKLDSPVIVIEDSESSDTVFSLKSNLYQPPSTHHANFNRSLRIVPLDIPRSRPNLMPLPRIGPIYNDRTLTEDRAVESYGSKRKLTPKVHQKPATRPGSSLSVYSFDTMADMMGS